MPIASPPSEISLLLAGRTVAAASRSLAPWPLEPTIDEMIRAAAAELRALLDEDAAAIAAGQELLAELGTRTRLVRATDLPLPRVRHRRAVERWRSR